MFNWDNITLNEIVLMQDIVRDREKDRNLSEYTNCTEKNIDEEP